MKAITSEEGRNYKTLWENKGKREGQGQLEEERKTQKQYQ